MCKIDFSHYVDNKLIIFKLKILVCIFNVHHFFGKRCHRCCRDSFVVTGGQLQLQSR